jgi:hypothetical protein
MRNNEERFGVPTQLQDGTPPQVLQQTQGLSLDFIVPTEIVPLPSKGKFYPLGHPLKGKDSIEIRQMTAKEEDILTNKSLLKKGVALDKLIQSLIVDKTINPDTLTIDDRNAIIIAARIAAYGAEYATQVSCPSCSQKSKYSFNLMEKLPKEDEEISETIVDDNGFFTISLPATKWNVVCRALNGNDEKNLLKTSEMKKKSSNDSIFLDQLKMMVVAIQNVTDRPTLEKALAAMPAGDTRHLRREYQKAVESVDMRQTFVCSHCEEETVMEVPLSADFFWFK